MIIAVDFDGTLCESAWPDIGRPNYSVIEALKTRQSHGDRIILWTCREGQDLADAVHWCWQLGLRFDAINANLPEHIQIYGGDCRKVYADEYWDDKAVRVTAKRYQIGRPGRIK